MSELKDYISIITIISQMRYAKEVFKGNTANAEWHLIQIQFYDF